jgi:curved DNA-binding protein CbpA
VSEFDPKVDYYAVLGVPSTASEDEIQKAYRALAAKYHPDKHQGNELEDLAREKLTQLNAAFAVVGNPAVRARYDAARRGVAPTQPGVSGTAADPLKTARTILIVVAVLAALFFGRRLVPRLGELMFARWRVTLIVAAIVAGLVFLPRVLRNMKKK